MHVSRIGGIVEFSTLLGTSRAALAELGGQAQARDERGGLAGGIAPTLVQFGYLGYTTGMKTAISLPDAVFYAAERQAKRAQKSRSQLYADAISEYLNRHSPDEVTEAMNNVVDQLPTTPDAFVLAAAQSVLARTEW